MKSMRKILLLSILIFLGKVGYSQTKVVIVDGITKDPLPYTTIQSINTKEGFITNENGVLYESNNYNSSTGNYSVVSLSLQRYIINDYLGDFLVVKLPVAIYLSKFHIFSRTGVIERAPSLWKIYASNDNSTWIEITDASNTTTALTTSNYSLGFYEKLFTTLTTMYSCRVYLTTIYSTNALYTTTIY